MTVPPDTLTFVDVETTGLSPLRDRIIEIGILRMEKGRIKKKFNSLVNPEITLPPEITMLTGITSEQLENAPVFSRIAPDIRQLLEGSMFVAHNAKFDYSFLRSEFLRLDESYSSEILCTAKLSRRLYPRFKRHSLDSLIERHGFACALRHRAFDDAKVLAEFWKLVKKQFGTEILADAITAVTKSSALPPGISQETVRNLPESAGVYLFYGDNGSPLYIGKSVNIRERVRSHFYDYANSGKEAKIFQTVKSIESRTTSGELGALLLESQLIKEYQPLYNRMLRKPHLLTAVYRTVTPEGYYTVDARELSSISPEHIEGIVAIYRTRGHMKKSLVDLCYEHALCQKLMGLEKTNGRCFGSQIETCHGACVGSEPPAKYNMRFTEAFARTHIRQWPFPGPIGITEGGKVHVVYKWCYLGLIGGEYDRESVMGEEAAFDYDTYKILASYLLKRTRDTQIRLLTDSAKQPESDSVFF